MSKKKKAQGKVANAQVACAIESLPKLGQKCAQVLQGALGLTRVIPVEIHRSRGVASLYFQGIPPVAAEMQGDNRPVIPVSGAAERWLHVSIDLRAASGLWVVRHVSVGLLKGDLATPTKRPLLRAEWMLSDDPEDAGHAQPHWHVLEAARGSELPKFNEIVAAPTEGFDEFLAEVSSTKEHPGSSDGDEATPAFEHFHYAMASDWHRTPSAGVRHTLTDDAALATWLGACVTYIRHQLEHVDRKAGPYTKAAS